VLSKIPETWHGLLTWLGKVDIKISYDLEKLIVYIVHKWSYLHWSIWIQCKYSLLHPSHGTSIIMLSINQPKPTKGLDALTPKMNLWHFLKWFFMSLWHFLFFGVYIWGDGILWVNGPTWWQPSLWTCWAILFSHRELLQHRLRNLCASNTINFWASGLYWGDHFLLKHTCL